jgi:hypothetical protein
MDEGANDEEEVDPVYIPYKYNNQTVLHFFIKKDVGKYIQKILALPCKYK